MRTPALIVTAVILMHACALGQAARTYQLSNTGTSAPPSNSINELVVAGDTLWAGTSRGPAIRLSSGQTWTSLSQVPPLKSGGVSGIAVDGDLVVLSYATSTEQDGEFLPTGDDLYLTTDRGSSWSLIPQPLDDGSVDTLTYGLNRIASLNITTKINNITYDIAAGNGAIWTANFAGMLRRSMDLGVTWDRVILPPDTRDSIRPTDSLDFDLAPTGGRLNLRGNLNHRVFAVTIAGDSSIWVGTAGGINRSSDGGISWRKFSHQNQMEGISGNFVVALKEQQWAGGSRMWAATVNADDPDEFRGVSYSSDNGETWRTGLAGEFAHNIAFNDSIAYVATDGGLFRTSDGGSTWQRSGAIADPVSHQRLTSPRIITVATLGDTIWVGGPDGTAWTIDSPAEPFGTRWTVQRTAVPLLPEVSTYAYPVPFSPDDEVVRIRYSTPQQSSRVTIRIVDFGMQPVRTLIADASRVGAEEYDEIWDGRTDAGTRVANGVYFYRVEFPGSDPVWGKILVVQ